MSRINMEEFNRDIVSLYAALREISRKFGIPVSDLEDAAIVGILKHYHVQPTGGAA